MASCPICQKAVQADHRPFCSERCRQVDLGRWLKGAYAIPAESSESPELPDEAEDAP
ncbi:MAG: DNA gyrase inhibitor YacG [Alphaproteobacteria bacterium]|nr:DNA gyrase inhibitor YacG [Alphaproteobacteria bacterium]